MKKQREWEGVPGVVYPTKAAASESARIALRQRWASVPGVKFTQPSARQLTADQLREQGWCGLSEAAAIFGVSERSVRRLLVRHKAQYCTVKTHGKDAMMWRRDEVLALHSATELHGDFDPLLIYVSAYGIAKSLGLSVWSVFRAAKKGLVRTVQVRGHHNTPCRLYCLNDMEAVSMASRSRKKPMHGDWHAPTHDLS